MNTRIDNFCHNASKTNEPNFIIVKAIEELNELSSALAEYLVKPISNREKKQIRHITEEIAHVEVQLETVRYLLDITRADITTEKIKKVGDLERYKRELGDLFGKIRINEKETS